jgi:hypothetical protein
MIKPNTMKNIMKNIIKEGLAAIIFCLFHVLIWKTIGIEMVLCLGIGQILAAIMFSNNN